MTEPLIDLGHIERGGIKWAADPFQRAVDPFLELVVLGVGRIGQCLHKVLVAGRAAHVLRRTGVFSCQAQRQLQRRVKRDGFLHLTLWRQLVIVGRLLTSELPRESRRCSSL